MTTASDLRVRRFGRTATTGAMALVFVVSAFLTPASAVPAPQITSPTQGSLQPAAVRVAGTAAGASSVEIFDGGVSKGTATPASSGAWSKTIALVGGSHSVTAVAHNGATDVSAPSAPVTFTVDAVRPAVAVGSPKQNGVVASGAPEMISGSASDDRGLFAVKLEYWSIGRLALRALADCTCSGPSATWAHSPNLAPGYYTVIAYAIDVAANQSLSVSRDFLISSQTPPMPTVQPIVPGMPAVPNITAPTPGATVPGAGRPVTVAGRGGVNNTVKIYEQSLGPIGTVQTDGRGYFRYTTYLRSGTYRVTAQAQDAKGVLSNPSKIVSFQVDADRPNVAFLTQNQTVFLPLEPVIVEGRIFDNRRVAAVRLEYWLLNGVVLRDWATCAGCSTTDAIWRDAPNLPYPGTYSVVARGFDAAGNQSYSTTITIVRVV